MFWHRLGACYTAKLTFSHDLPVKVWGARCTSVRIVFEFICIFFIQEHILETVSKNIYVLILDNDLSPLVP